MESNIRVGVLEQFTIDLLDNIGTSTNLFRKGIIQRHILLQFDGERMCLPLTEMTDGRVVTIYGQYYLLQDLIKKRLNSQQRLWFEIDDVRIEHLDDQEDSNSCIRFRQHDQSEWEEIYCDFIGGCDGASSDCCQSAISQGLLQKIERIHPFCWLSLLVEAPANEIELLYSIILNMVLLFVVFVRKIIHVIIYKSPLKIHSLIGLMNESGKNFLYL